MPNQDRVIAGALLAHGALGILWTSWIASSIESPAAFLIANLTLATVGVVAGVGWFKQWRWAGYFSVVFYLAQLVHVLTPTFQWSFTLGFNLNVSLGWLSDGELGVNLFALAMLLWSSARAFSPDSALKPNPLRSAP
jgi:hypothetical protein